MESCDNKFIDSCGIKVKTNISDPVRIPIQALRKSLIKRKPYTFTPEAAMEFTNLLLLSCDMIDDKCKQCKECKQCK